MNVEFKHVGGPFGDCTSNYEVVVPKNTTVREFIKYIVREYSVEQQEWGHFRLNGLEGFPYGITLVNYARGMLFYEEPWTNKEKCELILKQHADRIIKKVNANGGWSCMCYDLYLEEEENDE